MHQTVDHILDTPLTTVFRYVTAAVIYMSGGIQRPAGLPCLTAWLLDRFSFAPATTTPKPSECNQQFQGHRTLRTTNCTKTLNYRRSSKLIRTCPVFISRGQMHCPSFQAHNSNRQIHYLERNHTRSKAPQWCIRYCA
jgi:hypothetical protein